MNTHRFRLRSLAAGVLVALVASPVFAQHEGHVMPAIEEEDAADDPHAGHAMPAQDAEPAEDPHAGHVMPTPEPDVAEDPHAGHVMPARDPAREDPHAGHAMPAATVTDARDLPATAAPLEPVPPISAADRAAAFPPGVQGHTVHDNAVHRYLLFDRLETSDAPGADLAWEAMGWAGTDLDRIWVRSEGERFDGSTESANVEAFYGRAVAPWWDGLVGVRHDVGEGPSRTFAAIGVVGQAPYKFEVEATAYVGQGGQAGMGVEAEYDTLLTNRLILQWLVEAEAWTQDDHEIGIGSGLSTVEAGLRLRYEFSRRLAPYIGVARERSFGETADLRRDEGDGVDDTRVVAGVRFWF